MTVVMVSVRYVVEDVGEAIEFYSRHLGFGVELNPAPGFAVLSRGDLRLLLNAPGAGGAGQAMSDGRKPEPGDGTASSSRSKTSPPRSSACAARGCASATR
jgi:hypothetical protein